MYGCTTMEFRRRKLSTVVRTVVVSTVPVNMAACDILNFLTLENDFLENIYVEIYYLSYTRSFTTYRSRFLPRWNFKNIFQSFRKTILCLYRTYTFNKSLLSVWYKEISWYVIRYIYISFHQLNLNLPK